MDTTKLPENNEMQQRMNSIEVAQFTPQLAQGVSARLAGTTKTGPGIVVGLGLAIEEYLDSMGSAAEFVRAPLWVSMPQWIVALVDDPQIQQDALQAYEQAQSRT